jgi:hypothetical protein
MSYVVIAIPIFTGVLDDKPPSELSEIIAKNTFLCLYLISSFTAIIYLSESFSDVAGYTARIGQFIDIIGDYSDPRKDTREDDRTDEFISCKSVLANIQLKKPILFIDILRIACHLLARSIQIDPIPSLKLKKCLFLLR